MWAPPDFNVLWAAHHVDAPYDTAALEGLLGRGLKLFSYPPTFLVVTFPLNWLSIQAAYLCWMALSSALLVTSIRHAAGPVLLFLPAVFIAGLLGQTSIVMGALLFVAATTFNRPIIAGVLLGIAACIKPQIGVLVPFLLLGARQWIPIAAALATVAFLSLAATLIYGPGIWMDWLRSLPEFMRANDAALSARYLALPGLWKAAPLALGALLAWTAGRRGNPQSGMAIAVATGLLGSMHALDYDAAALAPFAVAAALTLDWRGLGCGLAMLFPPTAWSVAIFAGFTSLLATNALNPPRKLAPIRSPDD